jgi:uncharacterized protein YjdB
MTLKTVTASKDIILSPSSNKVMPTSTSVQLGDATTYFSGLYTTLVQCTTTGALTLAGYQDVCISIDSNNNDSSPSGRVFYVQRNSNSAQSLFSVDEHSVLKYGLFTAGVSATGSEGAIQCVAYDMTLETTTASKNIILKPSSNKVMPSSTSVQLGDATTPFASVYLATTGGTASALNYYEETASSANVTWTTSNSANTSTLKTVTMRRVGKAVTLHLGAFSITTTAADTYIRATLTGYGRFGESTTATNTPINMNNGGISITGRLEVQAVNSGADLQLTLYIAYSSGGAYNAGTSAILATCVPVGLL